MSAAESRVVAADEKGMRLDRWFRRHFPGVPHSRLERLLRTGQVRVDGGRAKASHRLAEGQAVRVPPIAPAIMPSPEPATPAPVAEVDRRDLRQRVLYRDDDVIVLNKPAGLAVQGGTGIKRHLDAMLDALKFDAAERPKLVHRLDKDTSGVLLLARNRPAAAHLGESLRRHKVRKIYWALCAGVPKLREGKIDMPLAKLAGPMGERVAEDEDDGKPAVTLYSVLETAGKRAAWLALMPLSGRTHQLRVHCAAMGTPIQGDGKYGGKDAFLGGEVEGAVHLHARRVVAPLPGGGMVDMSAPLPKHMAATWRLFGFDPNDARDPFPED
jgi:23S rRNA pseudouridine955/2504/2580 synthase